MAGLPWYCATPGVSMSAAKGTVLQITAPSDNSVLISEWSASFSGASGSVLVELKRQSAATSGMGGVSNPPVKKVTTDSRTIHTTGVHGLVNSSQPTDTDRIDIQEIAAADGGYTWQAPEGKEILLAPGETIGIVMTPTVSGTAVASFKGSE